MKTIYCKKTRVLISAVACVVLSASVLSAQQQKQQKKEVQVVMNQFWSSFFDWQKESSNIAAANRMKKHCDWPLTLMATRKDGALASTIFNSESEFDKVVKEEVRRSSKSKSDVLEKQTDNRKFVVSKIQVEIVSEGVAYVICEVPYRRINPRFGKPFWLEGRIKVIAVLRKQASRQSKQQAWKVVFTGYP